jgi:Putative beta-lactamase-inhibitor-like, PepSY-like
MLPCLVFFAACETQPNTPDAFLKARFPRFVAEIEWDSSKANEIGAFFSDSTTGIGYEVYFDKKGQFQKLYTYVGEADLPNKIVQAIQQKYPNSKLAVWSLVEMPKSQFYHVELTNDKDYITVEIDASGAFLNAKVVPLSEQELRNAEEEGVDDGE